MKKRLGCLALFLAAGLGLGYWAIDNVLPYSIIKPWKHAARQSSPGLGLHAEKLALTGFGGIAINGWFVPAAGDSVSPNTVIFCHGIGGNCAHFIQTARLLAEKGWNSVLLDGRAHGESGGDIVVRPWGERSFYAADPFGNGLCFVDEKTLFTGR